MVKTAKLFGYIVFFILALMYFTPKVALYYFIESELKPLNVIISDESVVDNGFTLSVKDASLSFKAIESAKIKDINVAIFGIFNKISLKDVKLSSTASDFVPTDIRYIDVAYALYNPLHVSADAEGDFGDAELDIDLLDRKLLIKLNPSKLMSKKHRSTLRNLKKSKDGGYEYAKTF